MVNTKRYTSYLQSLQFGSNFILGFVFGFFGMWVFLLSFSFFILFYVFLGWGLVVSDFSCCVGDWLGVLH